MPSYVPVTDAVRANLAQHASLPAILDGDRTITHAELFDRVDRLSAALLELGVEKGDRVVAWLPNGHEIIEAELATLQSGAVWVALNAQMTWPEVCAVLHDTEPKVLIAAPDQAARIDRAHADTPVSLTDTAVIETRNTASPHLRYEELLRSHDPVRPDVRLDPEDLARLRYTSGTTGHARAAMLPQRVYSASLNVLRRELHPLTTYDRALAAAPLTHAAGAMVFPILAAGGANVLLPAFNADDVLEIIAREGITAMFAVPTIMQRLAASPRFADADLSSLRTLTYGGAPMPEQSLEMLLDRLGPALVQIFGLTEGLHPITTLKRGDHVRGGTKLRSIGTPTGVCDIRIVNEADAPLPPGQVGEISVRGPNVMAGYWRNETATAEVLHGGWLLTGDLGYVDDDGYFFIVDRKKDVVISGGFNVYTSEVEHMLSTMPGVAEAAVFGVPDPQWGELVCAAIHPSPGGMMTAAEIQQFCRERLSPYKVPKRIDIHEAPLPKSGAGKILKPALRQRVRP